MINFKNPQDTEGSVDSSFSLGNSVITVNDTVTGAKGAGGLFGYYNVGSNLNIDLKNYYFGTGDSCLFVNAKLSTTDGTDKGYVGALFGELENNTITDSTAGTTAANVSPSFCTSNVTSVATLSWFL